MAESALTVELSADIKNFTAAMQSATAQLSRVAQASRTTNTAVNSMANSMKLAAAGLAAFAGGQIASALNALKANFIELSEAPTRFKASLEALGQSSEQAAAQLDKVYEIAKKTGTGFDDVGTIVRRYTIAMKDLGASNDQINRVVETLLKIGTLGGASVAEMSSTVLQLGQALGSGVLRGEELNAIMESMPLLAQRLAQELGTTTGKLREMGKDGKLASDAVAKALINMSKDVDQSFAKIPLTVDRAMNNVKTAIAQAFNNPAVAQGIQALANGINQFASFIGRALVNIKAFANDMVVLAQTNQTAQAAMLTLVAVISTKLIPAIAALGVALARLAYSNPFTALAAAAAAVATAIITNWDQVKLWLTTALPAAVEGAKASFLSFGADVSESISKFLNWLKDSFRSVIQGIADDWQKLKQVFGYFDAAPKIDFGDTSEKLSSLREGADAARLAQSRLNEEFKKGSDELQRSRAAMDAAAGAADNVSNAFNKIGGAGGKGGGAADSLKKWADNLINTIDPANKLAQEIEKLNSAFAKGYLNAEQYAKGLEQIKSTAAETKAGATDLATEMGQFASNALNGFFDAIAAGKDLGTVFKNLATDLAKMAVQILIIKPLLDSLKSSFGSGGGLGGILGGIFGGRSFGGPPPAPPIPGAAPFVPFSPLGQYGSPQALLSGGRSGAVPTTGGAKVNVVINNNSRAQVEAAETTGQDGSKQIEVTIRDVVRSQILEGGFDRQFRGAFGMVRQGV